VGGVVCIENGGVCELEAEGVMGDVLILRFAVLLPAGAPGFGPWAGH